MSRSSPVTIGRFRRIRWTMTVVFAAATAATLVVLAVIAAQIDEGSRRDALDTDLHQRATSLASTVAFDAGVLTLDPLYEDSVARTTKVFAVVAGDSIQLASPTQAALPSDAVIADLVSGSRSRVVYLPATSVSGTRFQWGAASVLNGEKVGATVIVGDDMSASIDAHNRLLAGLAVTVAALTLGAALIGHLLSGRAIRPILRGLQAQEQFLIEAAHELRTPLTTLRLITDNGLRHPANASAALTRAAPQVDRLGRLIEGLLTRARIEAGTQDFALGPLRLDQLAELAVAEVEQVHAVHIETELSPTVVRGNPDLLGQAIRNLLENAVRYASHPRIVVRPTLIQVADTGSGIAPQDRARMLRAGQGRGEGTGTGLAIVAWVAGIHGGRLLLDDAPAGGLLVTINLPDATSSSPHRPKRTVES